MISASRSATYNKYTKYLAAVETESQAIRMTFFCDHQGVTFSRCIEIDEVIHTSNYTVATHQGATGKYNLI